MTHMLLAFWTPQQVKCPEALDLVEMRLMRHPQILEGVAFLLSCASHSPCFCRLDCGRQRAPGNFEEKSRRLISMCCPFGHFDFVFHSAAVYVVNNRIQMSVPKY